MLSVLARRLWLLVVVLLLISSVLGLIWATITRHGHFYFGTYQALIADSNFTTAMVNSLVLSAISTILTILVAVPTVYAIYVGKPSVLSLIEWLTLLPFVIPGVSLAIGYVTVYSGGILPLVGTPFLLPFAFTVLGLPFFYRAYLNSLQSCNVRELTEAASTLGAGWWKAFIQIVLPNLRTGIISGAVLVFALGMGEFAITQLTTGGNFITFPIYMESIFMYNPNEGAAMAVLSFLITWLAVGAASFLIPLLTAGGRGPRPGGGK